MVERQASHGDEDALEALAGRPKITPYQSFFWKAFGDLITERPYASTMNGIVPLRIPHSKIREYGQDWLKLNSEELVIFVRVMVALDTTDMSISLREMARAAKAK